MRYTYCPVCGEKLSEKIIGDEGKVPYCSWCQKPWFPSSNICVIAAVFSESGKIALIRQSYRDAERFVCVAGYVKEGETAEEAVKREVLEEIGVNICGIKYIKSCYHHKSDNLMLGFAARAIEEKFTLSGEVMEAEWMTPALALKALENSSIAKALVAESIEKLL